MVSRTWPVSSYFAAAGINVEGSDRLWRQAGVFLPVLQGLPEPVATGSVVALVPVGPGEPPVIAWRDGPRGDNPDRVFAGCGSPQPGHRFESWAIGLLRRATRHPDSISHTAEARTESRDLSGVLSHNRSGRGNLPIPGAAIELERIQGLL